MQIKVPVPKWVLCQFRILRDVNADCHSDDGTFYATIPIQTDAQGNKVLFTKDELELFFELAACADLTIQYFESKKISNDCLMRYIILTNFLNYETLLDSLCSYTAYLIRKDKISLN